MSEPKQAHAVHDGTVFCTEQRRTVDVLTCFACDKMLEIDLDSRRPKVVCAVAQDDAPARS